MKTTFVQQLFWLLPVLFSFLLPFGGIMLSFVVILWLIVSLFNIHRKQIFIGLKNRQFILLALFFLATSISAIFSTNKSEAATAVEIKLSFILFPWLLFCFQYPLQILKKCLVAFVSGNFFACIYLLLRATYYAINGQPEYFFYTQFSDFIHASYFAMYLIFAITIIVIFYNKWFHSQKEMKVLSYAFTCVFAICVFLCSSKLGVISFFIVAPSLFLYKYQHLLKLKFLVLMGITLSIIFLLGLNIFPTAFERLKSIKNLNFSNIDKTSKESTAVRVLIWQQALDLIIQKPLFGHGVGDANDQLYIAYKTNGLTGALQFHLNAHNQYLQTWIGLGMIGLILILQFTWIRLLQSLKNRNFLMFIFILLICLNFLVESMLQTAAGVLFFAFFYCLTQLVSVRELSHA